jgi:predicted regulator of Ras-like GTPase activity (Roadblock/LC7/MglB family)
MIDKLLGSLRGVSGVDGALIATRKGAIIGSDLNPLYTRELMQNVLREVAYMFDAVPKHLGVQEDAVLQFRGRQLFIRRKDELVVLVIALPHTEIDSLRIACNVLIAHTKKAIAESQQASAAVPRSNKPSAPATAVRKQPPAQPVLKKKNTVTGGLSQRLKR